MESAAKRPKLTDSTHTSLPPLSTGHSYPTTIDEVKRQLQAAKAARAIADAAASVERAKLIAEKNERNRLEDEKKGKLPIPVPMPEKPLFTPQQLKKIRQEREALQSARAELEEKLSLATWIEFRQQAPAVEFIHRQHKQQQLQQEERDEPHRNSSSASDLHLFAYELGTMRMRDGKPHPTGARSFLVTSYADFWTKYFIRSPSQRHYYELILENKPCHLYFDIEFKFASNLHLASEATCFQGERSPQHIEAVMSALIDELCDTMNEKFAALLPAPVTKKQILQLDSSSSVKFSRHLIVLLNQTSSTIGAAITTSTSTLTKKQKSEGNHIPPATSMFLDNSHAGRFVRYFCQKIIKIALQQEDEGPTTQQHTATSAEEGGRATELEETKDSSTTSSVNSSARVNELAVRHNLLRYVLIRESVVDSHATDSPHLPPSASSSRSLMIDQGVYTRNRCFRLFLSSKNLPPIKIPNPKYKSAAKTPYQKYQEDQYRDASENAVTEEGVEVMEDVEAEFEYESAPTLVVAPSNTMPLSGVSLKDIFMNSLVCFQHVPRNQLQLLTFDEVDQSSSISAEEAPAASSNTNSSSTLGKRVRAPTTTTAVNSSNMSSSRRFHTGPSPFPRLEQFLLKQLQLLSPGEGSTARISGWTYFKENAPLQASAHQPMLMHHSITYNLSNYRYCSNISRTHRSNGVYFHLDLLTKSMHQRCWDIDCKYFHSMPITIPNWMVEMELKETMEKTRSSEDTNADAGEESEDDEFDFDEEEMWERIQNSNTAALTKANSTASANTSSCVTPMKNSSSSSTAPSSANCPSAFLDDDDWDMDALEAIESKALAQMSDKKNNKNDE